MPEENPYAAPRSASTEAPAHFPPPASPRSIVKGWERLRLPYNAILFVAGIILLGIITIRTGLPTSMGIGAAITVGIGANIAYLLGPLTELYFSAILDRPELPVFRRWCFIAGTGGSLLLFLLILLGSA